MLDEGKNVILEIDIQGALKVKEKATDGVFILYYLLQWKSLSKE